MSGRLSALARACCEVLKTVYVEPATHVHTMSGRRGSDGSNSLFIQAVSALSRPDTFRSAEDYITSLRGSPAAISISQTILTTYEPRPSLAVQLHAVQLLRDAIILQWQRIVADGLLLPLLSWCITTLSQLAALATTPPNIIKALCLCIAIIWKRGLMDFPDMAASVPGTLVGLMTGAEATRPLGNTLALAVLEEFNPSSSSRASALNVSFEFHQRAGAAFRQGVLLQVFQAAAAQLIGIVDAGVSPATLRNVNTLLSVLTEALSWDFSDSTTGAFRVQQVRNANAGAPTCISPGEAWGALVADEHSMLASALFRMHSALQAASVSNDAVATVCSQTRYLVLMLCVLSGKVFRGDEMPSSGGVTLPALRHAHFMLSSLQAQLASSMLCQLHTSGMTGIGAGAGADDDMLTAAASETRDWVGALTGLLRHTSLASVTSTAFDLTAFLSTLQACTAAACAFLDVPASVLLAAPTLAPGGADQLKDRITCIMPVVDTWIQMWSSLCAQLADTQRFLQSATSMPPPPPGSALNLVRVRALVESVQSVVSLLSASLMTTRIQLAVALIYCGLDDDDPFEDCSTVEEHVRCTSARRVPLRVHSCVPLHLLSHCHCL
ncbi:MAG: hypothetical protein EOO41_02600, partial [Methanobacteriota archaeon]